MQIKSVEQMWILLKGILHTLVRGVPELNLNLMFTSATAGVRRSPPLLYFQELDLVYR